MNIFPILCKTISLLEDNVGYIFAKCRHNNIALRFSQYYVSVLASDVCWYWYLKYYIMKEIYIFISVLKSI